MRCRLLLPIDSPLNARQHCSNIVRGTPPVLQDIQAQIAGGVDIRVEHGADEFDLRRLVWVLFLKMHHQPKGAVLEGCVGGTDDDGVPARGVFAYQP